MRLSKKHLLLTLPFFILLGFANTANAQTDSEELIKVTEKGTEYQMVGWDAMTVYDPYNFTFYLWDEPDMRKVQTREDYYVALDELDRTPVFSFDGTCLLKEEDQLECSNEELFEYIKYKSIEYPDAAQEQGNEGIVYTSFMLNKDGNIQNIKVLNQNDRCEACEIAAVDILKMSEDKWYPAIKDGETISTHLTVPIRFNLKDEQ